MDFKIYYSNGHRRLRDKSRSVKLISLCLILSFLYGLYWATLPKNCQRMGLKVVPNCGFWWKPCGMKELCKLTIDVYYEVLCYDSAKFISRHLFPLAMKLNEEDIENQRMVTFRMWAFGKAEEKWVDNSSSWAFTCQHGDRECAGNTWHACAWNHQFSNRDANPMYFIGCTLSKSYLEESFSDCAALANTDYKELKNCAQSSEGNMYMHRNALQTKAQSPKIAYVPRIAINGHSSPALNRKAESDLMGLVCEYMKYGQLKMCLNI